MEENNPNQPANPAENSVQTQITPNQVHNQRGFFPIVLGILVLLIVVGGGAYYLGTQNGRTTSQGQNNPQSTINPENTVAIPTSTPTDTQTTSDTETVNWKTYADTRNNFSIKYPSGWTEKGPVADNDTTLVYLHADESFGEGPEPIQYYVWIYSDSKLPSAKLTKESLGAYTIYKTDELPSRSGALTAFITQDEKKYIAVSITPYDVKQPWISQDKYIGIFNKMLSTFKFTN